ncbi:MAG: asparagine synthase (glutamine-hydrolyzing) [Ardenticatenaceae bacterium]|nr:asparagine synthase (glutamine-hydrolyzing) [Ardenticatenaceae bacterium]
MCGICGLVGKPVDQSLLAQMTAVIQHRGPDDSGLYISPDGCVGLGNRRLAIQDLSSAGHMPMSNQAQTLWITYNGEVYNFPELRAELQAEGHSFHSGTDTEVILRLYELYGPDSFARLNGMFAIAIWDTQKEELTLARDRLGVKPIYYTHANGVLHFGSEIKSLLQDTAVSRTIEPEALHYFLSHLWVPGPLTMFAGIYKLPPGHYLRWQNGRIHTHPYWQITWHEEYGRSTADWAQELRQTLIRAVQRHLIADVPVGLFLSGGLDSSILLGLMSQLTQAPVEAYTIAFRGQDARLEQGAGEDEKYARLVANHFGANFHTIEVDPDIVSMLTNVLWHLDEPVADPAAINTLLISQAARSQATVLLSGQGADEVFAGYRVHMVDQFARWFGKIPRLLRNGLISPGLNLLPTVAERMPGVHPGWLLAFHRYFRKVLDVVEMSPVDRYVLNRMYYTQESLLPLYHPAWRSQMAGFDGGRRHRDYFAEVTDQPFINQMLHVDLKTFLPELNLTYGDKLSMAPSIEMRVPFLDYELIELMTRVPANLKLRGLTGKYILREAVKDLLPEAIIKRRKIGFGAPIRKWLGHDLIELTDDLLSVNRLQARGYFEPTAVRQLITQHREGTADYTYQIWALLTFELWQQIFIDATAASQTAPAIKLVNTL